MQEDSQAVELVLEYILSQLRERCSFDQAQGLLALVLRVHGARIAAVAELRQLAAQLHTNMAASWAAVDADLQAVRCMVSLLSNAPM